MSAYLCVFAPLLGFVIVGLFGHLLKDRLSSLVTCSLMAVAMAAAWDIFIRVGLGVEVIHIPLFSWIDVGSFRVSWSLYYDTLTAVMVMVVTTVSFLVHVYSVGYMEHDETIPRFMGYLSLFTFMMLMLVTADNLVQLFFGWEGVGVASYLLIGYWYHKPSACAAAIKAFVVNRVGDLGLVLGIGATYWIFKTVEFEQIFQMLSAREAGTFMFAGYAFPVLEVIAVLLFIGAMGKSAQLGLHTWLPDAMEGPTPVSALIHAATMVTAGVFLVARMSPLYEMAPFAREVMTVVGATTALFAGTIALTQNDIKRVIAYSTCSQLGYMFFAAGLSAYGASIFHLMTHAFFKALLFLGAGAVIHAMSDEQDMRSMGGIWRAIPVTFTMMLIGSVALCGLPFFAGFYSKDAILEAAWLSHSGVGAYAYFVGIAAALLTAFYSWRLIFMTFTGKSRASEIVLGHVHEPSLWMSAPLFVLSFGAIFAGYLGHGYLMSPDFWTGAIAMQPHLEVELPHLVHWMPSLVGAAGIGMAAYFYLLRTTLPQFFAETFARVYDVLSNKWYVDELYDALFTRRAFALGSAFWKTGDGRVIDRFGPDGMALAATRASAKFSALQTGNVSQYALGMALGLSVGIAGLLYVLLRF